MTECSRYLVVSTLVALILFTGCDGVTSFERANISDPGSPVFKPPPPTSLRLAVVRDSIELSWDDVSIAEDGYIVERAINDTTAYEQIAVLDSNATAYTDFFSREGLWRSYRISAFVNRDGERRTQSMETVLPTKAFGDTESSVQVMTESKVRIKWIDIYDPETAFNGQEDGFVVERALGTRASPVQFEEVLRVGPNQTTAVDSTIQEKRQRYTYQVRAIKDGILGPPTKGAWASIRVGPPSSLEIEKTTKDPDRIYLRWSHSSVFSPADAFTVEQSADRGPWTPAATVQRTADGTLSPSAVIEGVDRNTSYAYRIRTERSSPSDTARVDYRSGIFMEERVEIPITYASLEEAREHPSRDVTYYRVDNRFGDFVGSWEWGVDKFDQSDVLLTPDGGGQLHSIEVHPDGRYVLVGWGYFHSASASSGLALLDGFANYENDNPQEIVQYAERRPVAMAFSPDGSSVAAISENQEIRIYETMTGDLEETFSPPPKSSGMDDLVFRSTGSELVVLSGNRVDVWDRTLQQWTHGRTLPGNGIGIKASPSQDRLLVTTEREVHLLDATSLETVMQTSGDEGPMINAVFGPDGTVVRAFEKDRLYSSDYKVIEVWDESGERLYKTHSRIFELSGLSGASSLSTIRTVDRNGLKNWHVEERWIPAP